MVAHFSNGALTPRTRSWLLAAGSCLCLAEIWIGGLYYSGYQVLAGRYGWFPNEMAFLLYYVLFGLPAIALLTAALVPTAGERLLGGFDQAADLLPRETLAAVLCASALSFFLITLVRYGILKDVAISDDEHAYAFMGQLFATGRIYVPSLPSELRSFLDNQFIINNGKMYGMYFPGHPAALALGEPLHLMRWIPTVSATLTVPLAFGVARRLFGLRPALLTMLLLLVSPYFLFPSATLLAHSTASVLLMTFLYAALRLRETPESLLWWVVAGLAISWATLTRPFSAPFFAAPWLISLAVDLWRRRSGRAWTGATIFCLIGAAAFGLLLAYQYALSGSPFISGYQTFDSITRWGLIGKALEATPPLPSVHELGFTLARINFWLFGWPVSVVLLLFFQRNAGGKRLFASVALVFLVYAAISAATIYPVGPVHYSELAVSLVMLSASGLDRLVGIARTVPWHGAPRAAVTIPVATILCAMVTFLPVYGGSLRASADLVRASDELLAAQGVARALVFVQTLPTFYVSPYSWAYYRRNNHPDLTDPILYVNYASPERNKEFARLFPDRPVFSMGMKDGKFTMLPGP